MDGTCPALGAASPFTGEARALQPPLTGGTAKRWSGPLRRIRSISVLISGEIRYAAAAGTLRWRHRTLAGNIVQAVPRIVQVIPRAVQVGPRAVQVGPWIHALDVVRLLVPRPFKAVPPVIVLTIIVLPVILTVVPPVILPVVVLTIIVLTGIVPPLVTLVVQLIVLTVVLPIVLPIVLTIVLPVPIRRIVPSSFR